MLITVDELLLKSVQKELFRSANNYFMPIKHKIDKGLRLLYTLFYEDVDLVDAIRYASNVYFDPDFRYAKNTLVYLKNIKIDYSIEDIEEFAKAIVGNKKFTQRSKIAILVENPSETVAATIYAQTILKFKKNVIIELFSTLEAALFFLDLNNQRDKVSSIIQNNLAEVE